MAGIGLSGWRSRANPPEIAQCRQEVEHLSGQLSNLRAEVRRLFEEAPSP